MFSRTLNIIRYSSLTTTSIKTVYFFILLFVKINKDFVYISKALTLSFHIHKLFLVLSSYVRSFDQRI